MSKKTRKKSPKTTDKSAAAKSASVRSPKAANARAVKTGRTKAAKAKKTASPSRKQASGKASQTAASKPLKQAAAKAVVKAVVKAVLAEGAAAPACRRPRDGGDSVSLSDFAGQKLVVFFYPRANTPGCTKEAIAFTRLKSDFAAAHTAVLGVSADP